MEIVYKDIINRVTSINVLDYAKNRNFIDGDVTKLSMYISRGMISTKLILESLLNRNINPIKIEKFIQELAWRDYWQIVWRFKNINTEIKQRQLNVVSYGVPECIIKAKTGVTAVDQAIAKLYSDGYMHNHIRMYIASIVCNIAKCHWKIPAKWFYYHLSDGDWGSNALSWQWVCGINSSKKYYANQENINKFCGTNQKNTFLDNDYVTLNNNEVPEILTKTHSPLLQEFNLKKETLCIDVSKPSLIYNYYNIDPEWRKELDANKVLLIEPSTFKNYPVSQKNIELLILLSKNIKGIQVFFGEYGELKKILKESKLYFKEHPLNMNYVGYCDSRDWIFSSQNYYPSFFKFWNNYKQEINL